MSHSLTNQLCTTVHHFTTNAEDCKVTHDFCLAAVFTKFDRKQCHDTQDRFAGSVTAGYFGVSASTEH